MRLIAAARLLAVRRAAPLGVQRHAAALGTTPARQLYAQRACMQKDVDQSSDPDFMPQFKKSPGGANESDGIQTRIAEDVKRDTVVGSS